MSEQERLFAQYEDAFFALLMNEVAEAEGQELLKKNEQLLADPNAAVPLFLHSGQRLEQGIRFIVFPLCARLCL